MLRESTTDPAKDAAALLLRLGFATLALALPVGAVLSRRGVVLLFPIGVVLLVISGLIDGQFRSLTARARALLASPGSVATLLGVAWATVSLAWTPESGAAERLLGLAGTLTLAVAAYLFLPERTRSANLYLFPIGTAVAAILAVLVVITGHRGIDLGPGEDVRVVERGLVLLTLLLWPSVAWLQSRDRDGQALGLACLVAIAAVLAPNPLTPVSLAGGALAFLLGAFSPRLGAAAVGGGAIAALVGAVVLPFLIPAPLGETFPALSAWRDLVTTDPVRLATGRGFGALIADRLAGGQDDIPATPILQLWYELGLVGAFLAGAALWTGSRRAVRAEPDLLPSMLGGLATAIVLASFGLQAGQAWQPVAAVLLAFSFVAVRRGQYRTERPPAEASPGSALPVRGRARAASGRSRLPAG